MKSTKENKSKKTTRSDISARNKNDDKKEFPGYPPYAPNEDITSKAKRVDMDIDESDTIEHMNDAYNKKNRGLSADEPVIDNESNVTKEDLEALGPKDLSMDMGEDERLLKHRVHPVDFTAKDLDIPTEPDATIEDGGTGDEENNFYSLGGDAHENLEEGQP